MRFRIGRVQRQLGQRLEISGLQSQDASPRRYVWGAGGPIGIGVGGFVYAHMIDTMYYYYCVHRSQYIDCSDLAMIH